MDILLFMLSAFLLTGISGADECHIRTHPALLRPDDPFFSMAGYGFTSDSDIKLHFSTSLVQDVDFKLKVVSNFLLLHKIPSKSWSSTTDEEIIKLTHIT